LRDYRLCGDRWVHRIQRGYRAWCRSEVKQLNPKPDAVCRKFGRELAYSRQRAILIAMSRQIFVFGGQHV
jgi:hypothetical protein